MLKCSLVLLTLCLGQQAEARHWKHHVRSHDTTQGHHRGRVPSVRAVCSTAQWPDVTEGVAYVGASGFWVGDYKQALDETWLHLK